MFPGGIGLFKSIDNTRILSRQYPPSLNRTALLTGKFGKVTNYTSEDTTEKILRDPVRMVIKSTTASKREFTQQSLKSRLVFGQRFIKDVAITVTAKNDTTLSVRLKRAFTEYGKVDRPITNSARAHPSNHSAAIDLATRASLPCRGGAMPLALTRESPPRRWP
jgi:hypothetical protein